MSDKKSDRMEKKIDHIVERISSIDVTLVGQAVELKEHIRRTSLLEEEVRPIKKHIERVNGIVRFLGFLLAALTAVEGAHVLLKGLGL